MATQPLITLDEAKAHLRMGDNYSMDTLIADYLQMAFSIAEDFTNRDIRNEYTTETVPQSIRAAVLLILGTLFDNESDAVVGRSVTPLPLTAEKLLLPWRIHPYSNPQGEAQTAVRVVTVRQPSND